MMARTTPLMAALLLSLGTGCCVLFPSELLSSFVLSPNTPCDALAAGLGLGDFPEASTPADLGLEYEPFTATSANGEPLSAWWVPAQLDGELEPDPAGTVLIMHGTDGALPCTLPWVLVAASNRMHAVVFDYQGFGESGGVPDMATLLDDSAALLNWILSDEAAARQRVHLVGVSLGTGPALGLVALRSRPQIETVTLDSAYDPIERMESIGEFVGPVMPLLACAARFDFSWLFAMRDNLGGVTVPALFIHGEDDRTTPLAGAQTMYDLIGSPSKSLHTFEGMTHVQPLFLADLRTVSLLVSFWRDPTAVPDQFAAVTDLTIELPPW